jgi:hypothetical protein
MRTTLYVASLLAGVIAVGLMLSGCGKARTPETTSDQTPAVSPQPTTETAEPAEARPTPEAAAGSSQTPAEPGAPGGPGRRGGPHERFDANGDGLLTAQELPERSRDRIMRADANGDGAVSREELQQARQARGTGERPRGDRQ